MNGVQVARLELGASRTHLLRTSLLFLAAGAVCALAPFVEHAGLYLLASLQFLAFLVPLWLSWHRGEFDLLEPVHVLGLIFFVYLGLGAVWVVQNPEAVAYDRNIVPYIPQAALYGLLGYLALLGGYTMVGRRAGKPRPGLVPRSQLFVAVPGLLGLAGSFLSALWEHAVQVDANLPTAIASIAQMGMFFMFAWALAWLLFFSGKATRATKWMLFGVLLPGSIVLAFRELNDKSLSINLILAPMLARAYCQRRIPWRGVLAFLLVMVFVIFPIYNTFRNSDPHASHSERLTATYRDIQQWNSRNYMQASFQAFQARVAMINSLAATIRDVGRWVPYANGETLFEPILTYLIPRLIWPDKPLFRMGRDFGETFRLVAVEDRKTNIEVTVEGELYWNFGLGGIVVGMLVWGCAMRLLYRKFGAGDSFDPVRRAVFIAVMLEMIWFGAGIAAQTAAIGRMLVGLAAYTWLARRLGWLATAEPRIAG
ncbi:MAG TPA: hypothetical protein VJS92_17115 [Candidatus Polarisedimenticolaceae bacterium]|nr:hypothetical protein [Candidatus Polarisedimenticolaceae bacterium]